MEKIILTPNYKSYIISARTYWFASIFVFLISLYFLYALYEEIDIYKILIILSFAIAAYFVYKIGARDYKIGIKKNKSIEINENGIILDGDQFYGWRLLNIFRLTDRSGDWISFTYKYKRHFYDVGHYPVNKVDIVNRMFEYQENSFNNKDNLFTKEKTSDDESIENIRYIDSEFDFFLRNKVYDLLPDKIDKLSFISQYKKRYQNSKKNVFTGLIINFILNIICYNIFHISGPIFAIVAFFSSLLIIIISNLIYRRGLKKITKGLDEYTVIKIYDIIHDTAYKNNETKEQVK